MQARGGERREERSLGELFGDLARETGTLVRQEVQLAKTEATQTASRVGRDLGVLAVGGLVAYAGLLGLLAAAILGLVAAGLDPWLAALLVGAVVTVVGFLLVRRRAERAHARRLHPAADRRDAQGGCPVGETADQRGLERPAPDVSPSDAPEDVREDIEQTRAEMSETLDAIQDRLDPEALTEQAKDRAQEVAEHAIEQAKEAAKRPPSTPSRRPKRPSWTPAGQARTALRAATVGKVEDMARNAGDTAGGRRSTAMETVKAHPLAATVAGLSLGWLFLNRSSGTPSPAPRRRWDSGDTMGNRGDGGDVRRTYAAASGAYASAANGDSRQQGDLAAAWVSSCTTCSTPPDRPSACVQDKAGDLYDQAHEATGQAVGQVQEAAGQVADQVQETAGQVADQVQEQATRAQSFLAAADSRRTRWPSARRRRARRRPRGDAGHHPAGRSAHGPPGLGSVGIAVPRFRAGGAVRPAAAWCS